MKYAIYALKNPNLFKKMNRVMPLTADKERRERDRMGISYISNFFFNNIL